MKGQGHWRREQETEKLGKDYLYTRILKSPWMISWLQPELNQTMLCVPRSLTFLVFFPFFFYFIIFTKEVLFLEYFPYYLK